MKCLAGIKMIKLNKQRIVYMYASFVNVVCCYVEVIMKKYEMCFVVLPRAFKY